MNHLLLWRSVIAFAFLMLFSPVSFAQNSMLASPASNVPIFPLGSIMDGLGIASNGTDVVLLSSSTNSGRIYAIDIADNNPADAVNNTLTAIPNFAALVSGATAIPTANLEIVDIEVNPISKAIYLLAKNSTNGQTKIVSIKDNGATVSVLDMMSQTYSSMTWGSNGLVFNDMAYGNGKLYATSGSWSLDGEIGTFPMPFLHNSAASIRATTVFKTNWGSQYFTDAPLEKMDFASIGTEDRLMGVTVCAPGFSIKTNDIAGSGLLQVTEDFNVRYSPPAKVIHQYQNGTHYMFNLHNKWSPVLMRIGEQYIDGSQVTAGQYNANTVHLRTNSGTRTAGLTDNDLLIYQSNIEMMAFFDDYNLVILENDSLKLFQTGVNMTATSKIENSISVDWYPNPATHQISINLGDLELKDIQLSIFTVDGKEVLQKSLTNSLSNINLKKLQSGTYFLSIKSGKNSLFNDQLLITK